MYKGKGHREASPNERLKNERQLRGWSQGHLAKQLEVPAYYISRWERGEVWPSPYYQQKLCALFGRTAHELGLIPAPSQPAAPPEDPSSLPPLPLSAHIPPSQPAPALSRRAAVMRTLILLALVLALGVGATSLFRTTQHVSSMPAPSLPGTSQSIPTATATSISSRNKPPPTPSPQTALLAQDTFQRADQQGWGRASDGQDWGADATNASLFSIQQDRGVITGGQGGRGELNATLGPSVTDAELFLTGSISSFRDTASNFGVLLLVSPTVFYKAYLNGQILDLGKEDHERWSGLASVPFPAQANRFYDIRLRIQGSTLAARVWPAGAAEPGQWMVTAQNQEFKSGLGGVRVITEPGVTFTFTAFQEIPLT